MDDCFGEGFMQRKPIPSFTKMFLFEHGMTRSSLYNTKRTQTGGMNTVHRVTISTNMQRISVESKKTIDALRASAHNKNSRNATMQLRSQQNTKWISTEKSVSSAHKFNSNLSNYTNPNMFHTTEQSVSINESSAAANFGSSGSHLISQSSYMGNLSNADSQQPA